jgi:hypothetical protein
MRSASVRKSVSLGPPAAYGTMIVIERVGYTCAVALATTSKVTATVNDARTIFRICMVVFLGKREGKRHGVTLMSALFATCAGRRYKGIPNLFLSI